MSFQITLEENGTAAENAAIIAGAMADAGMSPLDIKATGLATVQGAEQLARAIADDAAQAAVDAQALATDAANTAFDLLDADCLDEVLALAGSITDEVTGN